jgi:hypothetical protein
MAIPILNHLDFQKSAEIQNVLLHTEASGNVTSPGTGQIIYDSGTVKFYNGSDWVSVGTSSATGDIEGVTAGVGLSGGGASGTVDLAIDISEYSDVTPANGDKLLTLDSDGANEQLSTVAALATLFAGSGLTATNSVIAVDTLNQNTTGSSGSVANALTFDNATIQLNSGTTYDGSAARTVSAKTAAIANAGAALATADQIHTFVTTQTDAMAAGTSGNAATATLSTNSTHVLVTDNEDTNEENAITFVEGATKNSSGQVGLESDGTLTYNPSSGTVTATAFAGNITGNVTGNADTVTTNANLTGHITSTGNAAVLGSFTSAQLATALTNETGSGAAVFASSPTLVAPALGTPASGVMTNVTGTAASLTAGNATLASTVTITDKSDNVNYDVLFGNSTSAVYDDTGALYYNPSTGNLRVPNLTVAGTTTTVDTVTMQAANAVIFEGATADDFETTLSIVDPTADRTQYLINQGGYIPVLAASTTTAITSTPAELNVLDGIPAGLTATEIGYVDGVTSAIQTQIDSKSPTAGNTSLTTVGTIGTGTWEATDIGVAYGGTGVSTLTDGGVLLGSGSGAITAMAVLADGEMIVGDGTTDPVAESGTTLRTSIGVDAAGTDNSTDVTLAGSLDYLTISGQAITRNAIVLTTDVSGILPEANLPNASETGEGVVELATPAEVRTGTDAARVVTADALAAKSVAALILTASLDATELSARIAHNLGTKNLVVNAQLKGAGTDNQYCIIDWECTTDGSTDSSNDIYVKFAAAPSSDVVVNITSIAGATAITPTYPS